VKDWSTRATTARDEPARRRQPHKGLELRWGLVKLIDWFDRQVVRHRVFRLCCLIADSPWWTGHTHLAASYTAQAGGIAQHELAIEWQADTGT
jgi:hypothetical protein